MEVFIRNLSPSSTVGEVEEWLIPILNSVDVHVFDVRKRTGKPYANLTIPDDVKARKLIEKSHSSPKLPCPPRSGRTAEFRPDRKQPDGFLLKALDKEEKERVAQKHLPKFRNNRWSQTSTTNKQSQKLEIKSINCGRWEIENGHRVLVPYYNLETTGSLVKKGRALAMRGEIKSSPFRLSRFQIVFDYMSIESISVPTMTEPDHITITLALAPKFFQEAGTVPDIAESHQHFLGAHDLGMMAELLSLSHLDVGSLYMRESTLPGADDLISGTCFVYRINLHSSLRKEQLRDLIESLTSRQVFICSDDAAMTVPPRSPLALQVKRLDAALMDHRFSFAAHFQLQALWANAILSPLEIERLLPVLKSMMETIKDDGKFVTFLRLLQFQITAAGPGIDPFNSGFEKAREILRQDSDTICIGDERTPDGSAVHRVTVTPAGTYLNGPDIESPNRVLRQYAGHESCFLRVTFTDEPGEKVYFDSEASNNNILRGRFLGVLRNGLYVAGKRFDFLGFSNSSLRSQSCWFMRPFIHKGLHVTARTVIPSLGDFDQIRCPAKCAARIGQAFSDTQKAMSVDPNYVHIIQDIERGSFVFTDGCGTISKLLWADLKRMSWGTQPTLYQIRYKGAKGMLSLDTSLEGYQMRLRPSMVKFTGSPSNDLEICGTNARPLPFRLNRQLIKILEDRGVKCEAFESAMERAVEKLRASARSKHSAVDFFCSNLSNDPGSIAQLLINLTEMGIDVVEDQFIRVVIRALIEVQLRDLKFRTQIPVNQAVTLYGICDETGFLKEGQIYVTFETEASPHDFLEGRVAVTRCPALHPGDIQIAKAVGVPSNSPLRQLTNCVVFSQKGARDMPSKLAGGDLDGDHFGVIFDKTLLPTQDRAFAADYPRVPSKDLGRAVTSEDITAFFIDFMESDQLGRIATLHQIYADRESSGTFSETCITLATLHSAAVDFSKTGHPVNFRQIPETPKSRPDFMAPSAGTKVYCGIMKAEEAISTESEDPHPYRYYESQRALGKLYRLIDEDKFFEDLEDDENSICSREGTDDVMSQVWEFVLDAAYTDDWEKYTDMAHQVKDYYTFTISDLMSQYASWNTKSLTEQEVFIGTIIGRSGAGSRRQREQSELMRARYKREVQDIRLWMKNHTDGDEDGYLSLAIACLGLCVAPKAGQAPESGDDLRSFAWFAAAICVPKLIKSRAS